MKKFLLAACAAAVVLQAAPLSADDLQQARQRAAASIAEIGLGGSRELATFHEVFGEKYARALSPGQKPFAVALARELLDAGDITEDRPALRAILCKIAYDLSHDDPGGWASAVQAANAIAGLRAPVQGEWLDRAVELRRKMHQAAGAEARARTAEQLADQIARAADAHAEAGRFDRAAEMLDQAAGLEDLASLGARRALAARAGELRGRHKANELVDSLSRRVKANPADAAARAELAQAYVVHFDDPWSAGEALSPSCPAELRRLIALAARPVGLVSPTEALELAGWYCRLAGQAQPPARQAMRRRLSLYLAAAAVGGVPAARVAEVQQAAKALSRRREMDREVADFMVRRRSMPPAQQLTATAAMLADLNRCAVFIRAPGQGMTAVEGGAIVGLDFSRQGSSAFGERFDVDQGLTDIDPLHGLPLRRLSLATCSNLRGDLWALTGMPLEELDLDGCDMIDCIAVLASLPLKSLVLPASPYLGGDLSLLGPMPTLRTLTVQGGGLALAGMPRGVTDLTLRASPAASLQDLAGLPLQRLTVERCFNLTSLAGIERMPLQAVRIADCPGLTEGEYQRLARIATLTELSTGDPARDRRILQQARSAGGQR